MSKRVAIGFWGVGVLGLAVIAVMAANDKQEDTQQTQSNTPPAALSCSVADFSLMRIKASTEYDYAKLTGVVTNHCKSAMGVQLKWTAFNSDGTVAFSDDFWPASTTNIPPGTDYAFEMMNESPRGRWTYKVEPVSLNVW